MGVGRRRVLARRPSHDPEVVEGVGLAEPVADVAVDVQGLLVGVGRRRVLARRPSHDPQVAEGTGLAEPVAEIAVDGQW